MAPRTKAPTPAAAAAEVAAARGPQPASPVDQLRATQARLQAEAAAAPQRPVAREPVRAPAMPVINGRVTALSRSGQPIQRTSAGSGIDQFHIPEGVQPLGWTWAWKNESVLGKSDDAYMSELLANGWEPVRAESYPGKLAPLQRADGSEFIGPIRRHGMILMEQPEPLTLEARREEKAKADNAIQIAVQKHTRGTERHANVAKGNVETQLTGRGAPVANRTVEGNIPNPGLYDRQPVE